MMEAGFRSTRAGEAGRRLRAGWADDKKLVFRVLIKRPEPALQTTSR
jgi:hypothetical protein